MPATPVTARIHALRIPFRIAVAPGVTLERVVYSYLLAGGETLTVIDAGVAGSEEQILAAAAALGFAPAAVTLALLTHAHPDHLGGLCGLRSRTGCRVAAPAAELPWITDVARQQHERPVPGFALLVGGSVPVDLPLTGGERLDLSHGHALRVLSVPGHSPGHLAYVDESDGALFCGDAVPLAGELPVYDDALATARSLRWLQALAGVHILCAAWAEPRHGATAVAETLAGGLDWLQQVHAAVLAARAAAVPALPAAAAPLALLPDVLARLGLPARLATPLLARTVAAHLAAAATPDLRCVP